MRRMTFGAVAMSSAAIMIFGCSGGDDAATPVDSEASSTDATADSTTIDSHDDALADDPGGGDDASNDSAEDARDADASGASCTFALCDGGCVDLTGDHDNCGGCGINCETQECSESMCIGVIADLDGTITDIAQTAIDLGTVYYAYGNSTQYHIGQRRIDLGDSPSELTLLSEAPDILIPCDMTNGSTSYGLAWNQGTILYKATDLHNTIPPTISSFAAPSGAVQIVSMACDANGSIWYTWIDSSDDSFLSSQRSGVSIGGNTQPVPSVGWVAPDSLATTDVFHDLGNEIYSYTAGGSDIGVAPTGSARSILRLAAIGGNAIAWEALGTGVTAPHNLYVYFSDVDSPPAPAIRQTTSFTIGGFATFGFTQNNLYTLPRYALTKPYGTEIDRIDLATTAAAINFRTRQFGSGIIQGLATSTDSISWAEEDNGGHWHVYAKYGGSL